MNYFELYPGDYLRDTTRLTLLEHGAYLRLLMAYYGEEEPLPADFSELFVIAGTQSLSDRNAVKKVAEKFFPVGADGLRHNSRADAEIAKAQGRMDTQPTERKASQAERAKRYRDRRASMFQLLRDHGIVLGFNAKAEDLEAAVMALASRTSRDGGCDASRDERDAARRDVTASRPQTPDPITTPERSLAPIGSVAQLEARAVITPGEACRALRSGGLPLQQLNSSHPVLLDAIAAGATAQQFQDTAAEAVANGKSFGWVCATIRGRLADALNRSNPGAPHAAHRQPRESLAEQSARLNAELDERDERTRAAG